MKIHPLEAIKSVIRFFADMFREPDGNGGKPSFSKIAGAYVIFQIVTMSWVALYDHSAKVPPEMMTMFWVLIGYWSISKVLGTMSPAVLDIARAYLIKTGVKVDIPGTTEEVKQ